MVKVSVVVPIYNVSNYLRKCLDSIVSQSMTDIEILCVDDCSTDNSASIVLEYAQKDKRVKLVSHKENMGLGKTRNTALDIANGEYVAFVDSDDYISINYLELLYNTAREYNADMVFTNNTPLVSDSKTTEQDFVKRGEKLTSGKSSFQIDRYDIEGTFEFPSLNIIKIWRLEFLNKNKLEFTSYRRMEDLLFLFIAFSYNPIIAYNHNAIYYYYQRSDSLVGVVRNTNNIPIELFDVFRLWHEFYKTNAKAQLKHSNFWAYRGLLYSFHIFSGSNKTKFYELIHNLLNELDVELDVTAPFFVQAECSVMKKYENILDYIKIIESKKRLANKLAWWIIGQRRRNKFRNFFLNGVGKKILKTI